MCNSYIVISHSIACVYGNVCNQGKYNTQGSFTLEGRCLEIGPSGVAVRDVTGNRAI